MKYAIIFITLAQLASPGYSQVIESSITRTQVLLGETFELTIKTDPQARQQKNSEPDFSPLERDFELLETSIKEYEADLVMEYWITLLPKTAGQLSIPELDVDGIKSNRLSILVVNANQTISSPIQELILESSVNKNIVNVQEEMELTLRLLYVIRGISSPRFTEIEIEDADVRSAGAPNQYVETVNGTQYGVYENKYIIVPQKSGPMEIPDILFRGEVASAGRFGAPQTRNDEKVSAFAEGMTVAVRERSGIDPL